MDMPVLRPAGYCESTYSIISAPDAATALLAHINNNDPKLLEVSTNSWRSPAVKWINHCGVLCVHLQHVKAVRCPIELNTTVLCFETVFVVYLDDVDIDVNALLNQVMVRSKFRTTPHTANTLAEFSDYQLTMYTSNDEAGLSNILGPL